MRDLVEGLSGRPGTAPGRASLGLPDRLPSHKMHRQIEDAAGEAGRAARRRRLRARAHAARQKRLTAWGRGHRVSSLILLNDTRAQSGRRPVSCLARRILLRREAQSEQLCLLRVVDIVGHVEPGDAAAASFDAGECLEQLGALVYELEVVCAAHALHGRSIHILALSRARLRARLVLLRRHGLHRRVAHELQCRRQVRAGPHVGEVDQVRPAQPHSASEGDAEGKRHNKQNGKSRENRRT